MEAKRAKIDESDSAVSIIHVQLSDILPMPECLKKVKFTYINDENEPILETRNNIRICETKLKLLTIKERFVIADYLYNVWQLNGCKKIVYDRFCACVFTNYITSEDVESVKYWHDFGNALKEASTVNNDQWYFVFNYINKLCCFAPEEKDLYWKNFCKIPLTHKLWLEYIASCDYVKRVAVEGETIKLLPQSGACSHIYKRLLSVNDYDSEIRDAMFYNMNNCEQELIWCMLDTISKKAKSIGKAVIENSSKIPKELEAIHHKSFIIRTHVENDYKENGLFKERFEYKRYVHLRNEPEPGKFTRNSYKILSKYFPYTSDIDKHHMTTNLASLLFSLLHPSRGHPLYATFNFEEKLAEINNILRNIAIGTNQVLVCTILIAALGHKSKALIHDYILQRKYLLMDDINKQKILKALTTSIKRTQRYVNVPLSAVDISGLCYYELCFGRSDSVSDWEHEIKIRSTHTIHIQTNDLRLNKQGDIDWIEPEEQETRGLEEDELFYTYYKRHVMNIAKDLVPTRPVIEDFKSFATRRHEWVVEGSTGGEKIEILQTSSLLEKEKDFKNPVLRADKRAYMENIDIDEICRWLHELEPTEVAKAFEKFENAKARAIYGVEIKHYCINTYCTFGFEERMHHVEGFEKGVTGMTEYAYQANRAKLCGGGQHHMTMLDFADFNRHHTPRAQAIIFECFAEVGKERGFHEDWIKANLWVAKAKYNAWFTIPGDTNTRYPALQGMYSGTKSTDLINTVCNRAYYLTAQDLLSERYNIVSDDLYTVHQGDDIWISNRKRHYGAGMFYVMNAQGYVFQPSKQMFTDSWGEYLRVLYHPDGGNGYAVRGIVNYVLKPLYNQVIYDITAEATSLSDTYYVLQRRGLNIDILNTLWECDLVHRLRIIAHPTDRQPIRVPSYLIQSPTYLGGLGCARPGTIVLSNIKLHPLPVITMRERDGDDKLKTLMTDDWISKVSAELPDTTTVINTPAIKTALKNLNYLPVYKKYGFGPDLHKYKDEWKEWLNSYKKYNPNSFILPNIDFISVKLIDNIDANFIKQLFKFSGPVLVNEDNFKQLIKTELEFLPSNMLVPTYSCASLLRKIFASSIFKDVSMTARALGVSNILALSWITSYIRDIGLRENDDIMIIHHMMRDKREDIINFLTDNSFGVFSCLKGHIHPAILLECTHVAKEMLIKDMLATNSDEVMNNGFDQKFINLSVQLLCIILTDFKDLLPIMY